MSRICLLILMIMMLVLSLCAEINLRPIDQLNCYPFTITTNDACRIIFWSHYESGDKDIYCQKLNALGQTVWESEVPLVSHVRTQHLLGAVSAPDGTFFIAWREDLEQPEIRVQKVNGNGDQLWDSQGITITSFYYSTTSVRVQLVATDNGGVQIVFQGDNYDICAQSLDAQGTCLWNQGGQSPIPSNGYILQNAVTDGEGGLLINVKSSVRSRLYRLTSDAELYGGAQLVADDFLPGRPYQLLSGLPGEYILWNRTGSGDDQLQFVKIDNQGNLLIPAPVSYFIGQSDSYSNIRVQSNLSGEVYAAWIRRNAGSSDRSLLVQSFNSTFNPRWPGYGSLVAEANINGGEFELALHPNGSSWLSWVEDGENPVCKSLALSYYGDYLWSEEAIVLDYCSSHALPLPNSSGCIYIWNSQEEGMHRVRRQRLNVSGDMQYLEPEEVLQEKPAGIIDLCGSFMNEDHLISVWMEHDKESRSIFYQRTNQAGENQWGPVGRKLNPDNPNPEGYPITCSGSDGSVYILYMTLADDSSDSRSVLYLQKVNPDGIPEYPGKGINIAGNQTPIQSKCAGVLGDDVYLAWVIMNRQIMGQRISGGQKQWGEDGKLLVAAAEELSVSWLKLDQNWLEWTQGDMNFSEMMALKLDSSGNPAPGWNPEGLKLLNSEVYPMQRMWGTGIIGGDLYCFIVSFNNSESTLDLQKINAEGQLQWSPEGIGIDESLNSLVSVNMSIDDNISLIISEYDPSSYSLVGTRFIKISPAGEFLVDSALPLQGDNSRGVHCLSQFTDGSYLWVYTMANTEDAWQADLYYSMISSTGELHSVSPVPLCIKPGTQYLPMAVVSGNKAFVSWIDKSKGLSGVESEMGEPFAALLNSAYTGIPGWIQSPELKLHLNANYPNPFNPETTISFNLPQAGIPHISIYNLKGQLVRNIAEEQRFDAGLNTILWDGRDHGGQIVSSGIYFCRLSFAGDTAIRKMVLAK